jgi:hypothetical protein
LDFDNFKKTHLCHDRAGTDRSAFSNHPVGVDDGSATDNHLVFDNDGASRQSSLGTFSRERIFIGDVAEKCHVLADLHPGSDEDVTWVLDGAVCTNVGVVAYVDVVAVVAGERVVDDDTRADAAGAGLVAVVIAILVVGLGPFGWVEDAFEETAFLGGAGGSRVRVGLVPVLDGCFARPAVVHQIFVDVGAVRFADEHFVLFRCFA